MKRCATCIVITLVALFISLLTTGQVLRVATGTDAVSLDPHDAAAGPSQNVYVNIYETLTYIAPDGTIEPCLATSWEQVSDTVTRFYLREGVTFHDGTPFTASAVKFTIDRALDPEDPARIAGAVSAIEDVRVIDNYTVEITTSEPTPLVPLMAAHLISIGIVSPSAVETYGDDFGYHPVGTGPFSFVQWDINERIVLKRFDEYWGEPAGVETVIYNIIPDSQARKLAMQKGDVDMLLDPEPADLIVYEASDDFSVVGGLGLRTMFLVFDCGAGVTSDQLVRRAIAYAIDAELLAAATLEGTGVPAKSHIPEGYFGYSDTGVDKTYAYDLEMSRELLREAGWENRDSDKYLENESGEELQLALYGTDGRYPMDRATMITVDYMLRQAGFATSLLIEPWSTYIASLFKGERETFDVAIIGYATLPDASQFLEQLFAMSNIPPDICCNFGAYVNAHVSDLLAQASSNLDPDDRLSLYAEVLGVLAEELPSYPYAVLRDFVVLAANVKGYSLHPLDFYKGDLHGITME